ncbi:MAG: cysteine desulfurase NifS [Oscillospiraceae bacterium]
MKRRIYADNGATTRITKPVLEAMMPYLTENFGNPSSIYEMGRESGKAIIEAREKVAKAIGAQPVEIYFTGGGSESDNWAIKGIAHKLASKGKKHIITSVFEHHAVLHSVDSLEKEGFEITRLPITKDGFVRIEDVKAAIRPDTALVSIMYANNEIGTIQPIAEIGAICKANNVLFHTDAVQAIGNIEIDVKKQNIDMLSMSGHKFHAPKGVGALYCRKGIMLNNLIDGGGQERGKRAGTENVASIVAMGTAIELATQNIAEKTAKVSAMRDKIVKALSNIPMSTINGDMTKRLSGNVNMSFVGAEGEALLLKLDEQGICASSGSACTTGSLDPSHVLMALGLAHEVAHGSLRLTINEENTMEDADCIIKAVPQAVEQLRDMSPLWEVIVSKCS